MLNDNGGIAVRTGSYHRLVRPPPTHQTPHTVPRSTPARSRAARGRATRCPACMCPLRAPPHTLGHAAPQRTSGGARAPVVRAATRAARAPVARAWAARVAVARMTAVKAAAAAGGAAAATAAMTAAREVARRCCAAVVQEEHLPAWGGSMYLERARAGKPAAYEVRGALLYHRPVEDVRVDWASERV